MHDSIVRSVVIGGALIGSYVVLLFQPTASQMMQTTCAADGQTAINLPISKTISKKELEKYKSITISVEEDGKKVEYQGVPLRTLLAEMLPGTNLDVMPDVKKMARHELVLEAIGYDNYPGIITALEVAINHAGDRAILATRKDGKEIDPGVQLICKMDEARTRWIHQVVKLRLVALPKNYANPEHSLPVGDFGPNERPMEPQFTKSPTHH